MRMKNLFNIFLTFTSLLILFVLIQSLGNPLFLWNELQYHLELLDLRGLAKGGIFIFTYFVAIIPFVILVKLKSSRLFFGLLFFVFIMFAIDFFVQLLGVSHGFSYDEYTLAMNEVGNYKYLIAYVDTIAKAIGLASLVVLILYFIREKIARKSLPSRILIVTLFPMLMVYAACYKIDTFKLSSYPAPVKIPDIALAYLKYSQPLKRRILEEKIHPEKKSEFKNIVWIIDESVAGSYLSVNGYEKKSTPYLDKLATQSDEFVNFGLVNSISNCSSTSNLFLRIGMNPLKYQKSKISELPTIFQYAKRAGFTTWLFDSQTRKDHLQNYLTPYDKETIDHFETLGAEVERVERDERFLNRMIALVNDKSTSEKNFIVLVKYGAHFPYLLTYDQHFSPFAPVVESSYGGMNMEHREEVVNTYLNSLYFNVDLYFKKMLGKIDLSKSIVFYTSDHGQNILETKGLSRTHCNSVNVVKNEVTVPLFLFTNKAKKLFPKKDNLFYSQIQMFPTTLSLLGYSDGTVEKYGKTLKEGFARSNARHYILSSSEASKVYE